MSPPAAGDLWARRPDPAAREALYTRYAHLVRVTYLRRAGATPPGERQDLLAEGRLALLRAVDHYDPARGVKFENYAIAHIYGAFTTYLRAWSWAPRSVQDAARHGEAVERRTWVRGAEEYLRSPAVPVETQVLARVWGAQVRRRVGWLSQREAYLIRRYCWDDATLREIGQELGVCESRAFQMYRNALGRLRGWVEEW